MTLVGFARLLLLAALWGGSFLFMRMAASAVGPTWLILARVGLAAIFLWLVALWFKKGLRASHYWRHYLVLGFFNSALPFLLFAYEAQTISASLLSILNATAPMWAATLLMIPVALATPIPGEVPMVPTGLAVLALGIVCSGVAYLIYFRLIADFGGVSALTVAFLIPVFGTFWGAWLLGEPVTWSTLIGGLMVLMGTAMVTGFSPSTLFGRTR